MLKIVGQEGDDMDKVYKNDVLKIIDEVMNNREIDSIRNAILAIRDKVIEMPCENDDSYARLRLWTKNELCCTVNYFDGAKYVVIDTTEKVDTGVRGTYRYE